MRINRKLVQIAKSAKLPQNIYIYIHFNILFDPLKLSANVDFDRAQGC